MRTHPKPLRRLADVKCVELALSIDARSVVHCDKMTGHLVFDATTDLGKISMASTGKGAIEDRFGGLHTTDSDKATAAFADAVFAVLAHRPAAEPLTAALGHDEDLVAAHALKGLGSVLLAKSENFKSGAALAVKARGSLRARDGGTPGEAALVDALTLAASGHLRKAATRLEEHAALHPGDLLAIKLSNALRFMCGDRHRMTATTGAALGASNPDRDGHGFLLGLHAFGLEECGHFVEAERFGRRAVEAEPDDSWGIHAVGHVLEMQGRTQEGIDWFEASRPVWPACNNFAYHLAWHLSLFRLEARDHDGVLALYDDEIRPTDTDDFRDMANAVSILWRLEQDGFNVGSRWQGLYEIALKRRTDTSYVFASLHYLLALLAAGDDAAAADLILAMRSAGTRDDEQGPLAARFGADLALAISKLTRKDACKHSVPASAFGRLAEDLPAIGGSHAQRDVFVRTLLDLAARSGNRSAFDAVQRARQRFRAADRFDRVVSERVRHGTLEPALDLVPHHGAH